MRARGRAFEKNYYRIWIDVRAVTNLGIEATLNKFDVNSLSYLSAPETITHVVTSAEDFPLLVYRINVLNERFKDFESIKGELNRQQFNLERNPLRIYRLRNEIVHSAAKEKIFLTLPHI